MAESMDMSHDGSGESKDKISVEESSKADSAKQIRKHLKLLQKAKQKCDELSQKCISLEQERDAANEVIAKWRNESNAEYIEEMRYEIKALNKRIHQLTEEKGVTTEEFNVIKEARDATLDALKKMKHKLSLSVTENQNILSEIDSLKELKTELREQIQERNVLEIDLKEQLNEKCALETDLKEELKIKSNLEVALKEQLDAKNILEADLRMQLDSKIASEADLEEQLNAKCALEADLKKLREQLDARNILESDLRAQLDVRTSLEVDLKEHLNAKCALEADLKKIREQLDAKNILEANLREQLDSKSALAAELKEQLNLKSAVEEDFKEQISVKNILEANLREQLDAKNFPEMKDKDNLVKKLTEEYNLLSQEHEDMQSELESFKAKFDDVVTERDDFCKQTEELRILQKELETCKTLLENGNLDLKQKNDKLESEKSFVGLITQENTILKSKFSDLEKEVKERSDSIQTLEKCLEETKMENLNLRKTNKDISTELSALNLKYTDLLNKNCLVSDVQSMLLKLSCFADQAETQSLDIIEISEFICTQFEELKIRLDALENEKLHESESKENTISKIQELEIEITRLSYNLKSFEEENQTLKEKLKLIEKEKILETEHKESAVIKSQELETEISSLASKIGSFEKENNDLKEKLAKFTEEKKLHESEYNENTNKIIQELESEIVHLTSKYKSSEEENKDLKEQLEKFVEDEKLRESEYKGNAEKIIQELETEVDDLSAKLNSSKVENKNLNEKAESFAEEEKSWQNEHKANITRIQELEIEKVQLSSRLDSSVEEIKNMLGYFEGQILQGNEYIENATGKIQDLETRLTDNSLKLSSSEEENKILLEKLEKFAEKKIFQENEYKENVAKAIQKLETQISALLLKLSAVEEENKDLKEKLKFAEREESEYKENVTKNVQKLEAELSDLSVKLRSGEEENKVLMEKLEKFAEEKILQENEYKEYATSIIQELENDAVGISLKLESLEEENEDLKIRLEEFEKKSNGTDVCCQAGVLCKDVALEVKDMVEDISSQTDLVDRPLEEPSPPVTPISRECALGISEWGFAGEEDNDWVDDSAAENFSEGGVLKQSTSSMCTQTTFSESSVCVQTCTDSSDVFTNTDEGHVEARDIIKDISSQTDLVDRPLEEPSPPVTPISRECALGISEWGFAGEEDNDWVDDSATENFSEGDVLKQSTSSMCTQTTFSESSVCVQTCTDSSDVFTNTDEKHVEARDMIKDISSQTDLVDRPLEEHSPPVTPISRECALGISEWGFAGEEDNDWVDNSATEKLSEGDVLKQSTSSMCTQTTFSESSVCVQTCTDSSDVFTNTDETEFLWKGDIEKKNEEIKCLLTECESLKSQLNVKSKLLEEIHCRLDFLLAKEEELNSEIQIQNETIKTANDENCALQTELSALRTLSGSLINVANTLNDVKLMENDIKLDVKIFNTDFMAALSNVSNDILSKCNSLCSSMQNDYSRKIGDTLKEVECYKIFLNDTSLEVKEILGMFTDVQFEKHVTNKIDDKVDEQLSVLNCSNVEQFDAFKSNILLQCNKVKNNLCSTFEVISQLTEIRDNHANELSHYKTIMIPDLESKIEALEKSQSTSNDEVETESYQKSTDTIETLQSQLSETEIKMNKFKAIALKWKKELAECQQKFQNSSLERDKYKEKVNEIALELDNISTIHSQYVLNFQNLQNENDKLQDNSDDLKATIKSLQTSLSTTQADLQKCNENLSSMESELQKSKQLLSLAEVYKTEMGNKRSDLDSKIIILEAKNVEDQNRTQDLISELAKAQNDIADLVKGKELLKQELTNALKEGKQHSLLDLEMADYERSIEELTNKLERKNSENDEFQRDINNLKAMIDTLQAEIKICESHKDTEEKRASGFKELLENAKKELLNVKDHEAELMSNCAQLNIKVESLGQREEDYKSHLSKQSAEIERLKEMLKSSAESHHKSVRFLESKIASQKQDILMAHKEVESVKQDFENYKIRVHSVLKQQQKSVATFTPTQTIEEDNQKAQIEKLKLQIKDLSDKLYAVTLEKDSLQEKHDHLLQRYNKIVEEIEVKDRNWSTRIEHVQLEKSKLQSLIQEMTMEHALQNERITVTYKKQIKILQEEHNNALKDLQSQLESADIEITRLQREQQKYANMNNSTTPSTQEEPFTFDIFSQERQEGEGSECTEDGNMNTKHLSLATIPTGGFMTFEKLLQSPVESETSTSVASILDPEKLNNDLSASWKKIDHLRELLNESEANNLRLGDQVRLLKEEVRRLERNKQREEHAENLEYLKNVFVKFATLEPGSERSMLVPVLTTMLRLSPAEQKQLKQVAGERNSSEVTEATWGSYLHRWSGT